MTLSEQIKGLQHHSYILIATHEIVNELIRILETEHSINTRSNPDFNHFKYEVFTIDDARAIKSIHSTRPVSADNKKIFLMVMGSITVEAQNALLKLLEEPADYAHFFIIIPSAHILLQTVKSRSRLIHFGTEDASDSILKSDTDEAKKFVSESQVKRLIRIKGLMDEMNKDRKTKQEILNFLDAVQREIYQQFGVNEKSKASLESLEMARKYFNDRSPSLKMLLEYLALAI